MLCQVKFSVSKHCSSGNNNNLNRIVFEPSNGHKMPESGIEKFIAMWISLFIKYRRSRFFVSRMSCNLAFVL